MADFEGENRVNKEGFEYCGTYIIFLPHRNRATSSSPAPLLSRIAPLACFLNSFASWKHQEVIAQVPPAAYRRHLPSAALPAFYHTLRAARVAGRVFLGICRLPLSLSDLPYAPSGKSGRQGFSFGFAIDTTVLPNIIMLCKQAHLPSLLSFTNSPSLASRRPWLLTFPLTWPPRRPALESLFRCSLSDMPSQSPRFAQRS